ncbi:MAG TPA: amino acid carrier protein, partial [bacterium]
MVQSNSVSMMALETYRIPPWITGLIMTLLTAIVILGGIKSIARVCEILVPFMAIVFTLGCVWLLIADFSSVPASLLTIIKTAFTGQAALGGFIGVGMKEAIRYGVARGLFSNESGMGSAPIVAAAAQTKNPVRQALVSSTGTFWDTVVMCGITGAVIVNSGQWVHGYQGAALTKTTFDGLPIFGPMILTFGLLTFVFATLIGWSYYGEKAAEYLLGTRIVKLYRWLWVMAVMVGSVASLPAVWAFADIANGLMAVPNLVSLIVLSGVLVKETRKFLWSGNLESSSS